VGTRAEIARTTYTLSNVRFVSGEPPASRFETNVVLRYRGIPLAASVGVDQDHATLHLALPALVAPGQAAVFYDGDEVIGGGVVARQTL
jgi:tRNA-specific 2-thiouridylase